MALGSPIAPSATTNTDIYVVAASTIGTITRVIVCNRSATFGTFRVGIAATGTPGTAEWLAFDEPIAANSRQYVDIGDVLAAGTHVVGYASNGSMSFRACGDVEPA